MLKRFILGVFTAIFLFAFSLGSFAVLAGLLFYIKLTSGLPKIDDLDDYQPKAVTQILSDEGILIAEYFDERRYPVKLEEIPIMVRNAFLAAEDANFYSHPGIDFVSILRAVWINIQRKTSVQGASTITQQTVKALLLSREKTIERKIKEAILSYRLEKKLNKDDIFSIYLNQIFLGSTAFGVKAASQIIFHKPLDQLTLGEAAMLASLPQRPSELTQEKNRAIAIARQHYVLNQMLKNNMINRGQHDAALKDPIKLHPPDGPIAGKIVYKAHYFDTYAEQVLREKLRKINPSFTPGNPGGLVVKTTLNLAAQDLAVQSVRRGLREVDKRRGWRGAHQLSSLDEAEIVVDEENVKIKDGLTIGELYRGIVSEIDRNKQVIHIKVGDVKGFVDLKKATWATRLINRKDEVRSINIIGELQKGSVIEVSLDNTEKDGTVIPIAQEEVEFKLDQTPELEGAMVVTNALTGSVIAIVGGYDSRRSEFNRAFQALRQPGSGFKPFIYATAMEKLGFTPASIVPDSPITLKAGNGKYWTPKNYDGTFLGPITLRSALEKSRNVVSVYLLTRLADKFSMKQTVQFLKRFGFTTQIDPNLSISLGSAEVKIIDLVRAYGVFAAGGWLADELAISSITERKGKVLEEQFPHQKKVLPEQEAFLMAYTMKGVIDRGTAQVLKALGRPIAGKTGTTNNQMDAWFIGYTPEWVAGVWVGFDQKKEIGFKETGGKAAAPIFLNFMSGFLKDSDLVDFDIPDGVIPVAIDLRSGKPTSPGNEGAFVEYFKSGTEPTQGAAESETRQDYLQNEEF